MKNALNQLDHWIGLSRSTKGKSEFKKRMSTNEGLPGDDGNPIVSHFPMPSEFAQSHTIPITTIFLLFYFTEMA